ncbi:MAG: alpha/beta hydrolase [Bacillota bacterium]
MLIEIDGMKLNYKATGEGKDVVLLHGWGGQINSFEFVHKQLEKKFRTYSLDLPGFGKSDSPPEPWGIEDYSKIFNKFINSIKIHNPILIGHSFGGRIAIHYAADNNVEKLILVDSAGIKSKRNLAYYYKVYTYKLVKYVLRLPGFSLYSEAILQQVKKKLGSSDYRSASGVMQGTLVKIVNQDLRAFLPRIKAPTLLIWGDNDQVTPLSDAELIKSLIPNSGLVVLKNAGHYSYIDNARDFLIVLNKFLEDRKGS